MPPRLRLLVLVLSALLWWSASGCTSRTDIEGGVPAYNTSQPVSVSTPTDRPGPAPERPKVKADLRKEPLVGVLLASGPRVRFTLLVPARIGEVELAPGLHEAAPRTGGLVVDGQRLPADALLEVDGPALSPTARFAAELVPPFGARQRLEFAGTPRLVLTQDGRVQLIERIPLEGYINGVVPVEMSPRWPLEALKAQAIAIRTYATAKWLPRAERPWQLHWHFSVDMAYAGLPARTSATARQAVQETRGQIMTTGGQPFPALFHASSGGRTESAAVIWPDLAAADGRSATGVMPSVLDPACEAGTQGLKLKDPHWRWKNDILLTEVTSRLRAWADEKPGDRPQMGVVTDIRVLERSVSGRVAVVEVVHKEGGKTRRTQLRANDFRMAISPIEVASTWWDKCTVVKAKGGTLVLAGRGFGHGVGLSQVSAWQMARDGQSASAITARFYPEAVLAKPYP